MRFHIVAVGRRMPGWIDAGFAEYALRMPHDARVELVAVKPEPRAGGKSVSQILAAEARRIRAALPRGCTLVVLDERGNALSTAGLARQIGRWRQDGRDIVLVIGGADGVAPELKREAELLLSLSALTLPHGLARVVLAEQLYRACSLLAGHPYHRE